MKHVFWQEVRKILRPIPVLILVVAALIYGYVVLRYPYRNLTEFPHPTNYIQVAADFVELCGNTLEGDEFERAVETLEARYKEQIATAVRTDPRFAEAGVTDYEGYVALQRKILFSRVEEADGSYWDQEMTDGHLGVYGVPCAPYNPQEDYTLTPAEQLIEQNDFSGEMTEYARNRLQCLPGYPEDMAFSLDAEQRSWIFNPDVPSVAQRHIKRIYEDYDSNPSVMPAYFFTGYTGQAIAQLAILLACSVCVLLAPILTRDGMTRVRHLQYASKAGRKTLRAQFWAMLFTSALVAIIEITVTYAAYLKPWRPFLRSKINSPMDHASFFWYTGTVGGWLFWVAVLLFVFSLAAACFMFLLSKASKQYIALLLAVLPATAGLCFLGNLTFTLPLAMGGYSNALYAYLRVPFAEVLVCGVLLGIGTALAGGMIRKSRRAEV